MFLACQVRKIKKLKKYTFIIISLNYFVKPFFTVCIMLLGSSSNYTGFCESGFHCISGASTPIPTDMITGRPCPYGHYCPSGTPSPVTCPSGTFANTTGTRAVSDCLDCTPGMYCLTPGLTNPTGFCHAGYYCSGKAKSPTPTNGINGRNCTRGHYCPAGSPQPKPCDVSLNTFFPLAPWCVRVLFKHTTA